jgi:hypothetical protein
MLGFGSRMPFRGEARGESVLTHRDSGQAGLAIDGPKRVSFRMAATHVIVGRFPSVAGRGSREHLGWWAWEGRDALDRWRRRGHSRQTLQTRMDAGEPALDHLPGIEQEVPAVCNLNGIGRTHGCPTHIRSSCPVPRPGSVGRIADELPGSKRNDPTAGRWHAGVRDRPEWCHRFGLCAGPSRRHLR